MIHAGSLATLSVPRAMDATNAVSVSVRSLNSL